MSSVAPLDARNINATIATGPPRPGGGLQRQGTSRLGGVSAAAGKWAVVRAAFRANTIPGLDLKPKMGFAELVWKAKWQEEQRIQRAIREAAQLANMKDGAFASIEYAPPNNEVYRTSLKTPAPPNDIFTIVVYMMVGAGVGLLGSGMRLGIESLEAWRLGLIMEMETCEHAHKTTPFNATTYCTPKLKSDFEARGGFLIFFGVAAIIILVSASLVAFIAPAAAASGLPEVIAFLNGTFQGKIFATQTLLVKYAHASARLQLSATQRLDTPSLLLVRFAPRRACMPAHACPPCMPAVHARRACPHAHACPPCIRSLIARCILMAPPRMHLGLPLSARLHPNLRSKPCHCDSSPSIRCHAALAATWHSLPTGSSPASSPLALVCRLALRPQ